MTQTDIELDTLSAATSQAPSRSSTVTNFETDEIQKLEITDPSPNKERK